MAMESYCTITQADDFLFRPFTEAWDGLEDTDKEKYLAFSSSLIHEFCFFLDEMGEVFQYDYENVPDWLAHATAEQALYLVTLGKDPTAADKKTTLGIISTEGTTFDKSFAADILCVQCRTILENNGGMISSNAEASGNNVSWGFIRK